MTASKIDDKKGGGKELMSKWPMNGIKPNYLMLATGWKNQATATTYIINGQPSEEQIHSCFEQN